MHLNETEKRMLGGKFGKAPELAMNILSELSELYGAERMMRFVYPNFRFTCFLNVT